MTSVISNAIKTNSFRLLEEKFSLLMISSLQVREKYAVMPKPKLRHPTWFTKKNRVLHDDFTTTENKEFIKEVVHDSYTDTPLNKEIITPREWDPKLRRTGVIARKIGIYPLWLNDGSKILTTLLQVLDNHVIKYVAPEEYDSPRKSHTLIKNKRGFLLVGAEATDPTLLTKDYCGLFKDSGVMPKKILARFFISPEAILPAGTPLTAMHFRVGNHVDVRGKTIDRGFQGVMKKHGFKGMPASHGVTKTHRRGGNIGGGGEKGRVWPGTKMPGHMGNRYRILKGLKIWRINTKHNVLWVSGQAIAGETNSIVTIYDTILPLRRPGQLVPFPTYLGDTLESYPEDIYHDDVHKFSDPTIVFDE